jgi:DNA repair protein RadC
MRNLEVEVFKVLLLSTSNKIIREIDIAKGILNQVLVHPREIFKPAITENAASIIVMHNHPSGKNEPSKEDINLTNTLQKAVR